MSESKAIEVHSPPHFLSNVINLPPSKMSYIYNHQQDAEGCKERLTSTRIAVSGARDAESTEVIMVSNKTGEGIHVLLNSKLQYLMKVVEQEPPIRR